MDQALLGTLIEIAIILLPVLGVVSAYISFRIWLKDTIIKAVPNGKGKHRGSQYPT